MTASGTEQTSPVVKAPGEGLAIWHIDNLMTFKVLATDTGGRIAVWEQLLPHLSSPPMHVHHHDDEAWYVLEGSVTFQVADSTWTADAGTFVWAPRALAHTFRVDSPTARLLGIGVPAGFEQFFLETGRPAQEPSIPPPSDGLPDMGTLIAAAARFGSDVVGPPMR